MKEIDARDLACPAPVLMAKEAVEKKHAASIRVIVDNEAARQNVYRFLESQGFSAFVEQEDGDFIITGHASQCAQVVPDSETRGDENKRIMIMIATDRIGYGDDELGKKLMKAFLGTVNEMGDDLWRLVFVNNGVKLTVEKSDVLDSLQELEQQGIHILVCGTCLSHFDMLEKKQVGETTNMLDIVTAMQLADKVVNV